LRLHLAPPAVFRLLIRDGSEQTNFAAPARREKQGAVFAEPDAPRAAEGERDA
jgi:hypothetical protein